MGSAAGFHCLLITGQGAEHHCGAGAFYVSDSHVHADWCFQETLGSTRMETPTSLQGEMGRTHPSIYL